MPALKNDYFTLVKIPSEKKKIFHELVQGSGEIIMKGSGENIFRLVPRMISENRWICCDFEKKSTQPLPTDILDEPQSGNFAVGSERYFFRSPVKIYAKNVMLEMQTDLYHLQRRKTMRVAIPEIMGANCTIINNGDHSGFYACDIVDFSGGGVKLLSRHPNPVFKINDILVMIIRLGENRKEFQVKALVRHTTTSHEQILGLQFIEVDRYLQNKLMALQIDLQTDIFRKWKRLQL